MHDLECPVIARRSPCPNVAQATSTTSHTRNLLSPLMLLAAREWTPASLRASVFSSPRFSQPRTSWTWQREGWAAVAGGARARIPTVARTAGTQNLLESIPSQPL